MAPRKGASGISSSRRARKSTGSQVSAAAANVVGSTRGTMSSRDELLGSEHAVRKRQVPSGYRSDGDEEDRAGGIESPSQRHSTQPLYPPISSRGLKKKRKQLPESNLGFTNPPEKRLKSTPTTASPSQPTLTINQESTATASGNDPENSNVVSLHNARNMDAAATQLEIDTGTLTPERQYPSQSQTNDLNISKPSFDLSTQYNPDRPSRSASRDVSQLRQENHSQARSSFGEQSKDNQRSQQSESARQIPDGSQLGDLSRRQSEYSHRLGVPVAGPRGSTSSVPHSKGKSRARTPPRGMPKSSKAASGAMPAPPTKGNGARDTGKAKEQSSNLESLQSAQVNQPSSSAPRQQQRPATQQPVPSTSQPNAIVTPPVAMVTLPGGVVMEETVAHERIEQKARQWLITFLDNQRVFEPVESVYVGMRHSAPDFKKAVKKVRKVYKSWKGRTLEEAKNWVNDFVEIHPELAAVVDYAYLKSVIKQHYAVHLLPTVFHFAVKVIDFEDCSDLALEWLEYCFLRLTVTCRLGYMLEKEMETRRAENLTPALLKYHRNHILDTFDELFEKRPEFHGLTVDDFPVKPMDAVAPVRRRRGRNRPLRYDSDEDASATDSGDDMPLRVTSTATGTVTGDGDPLAGPSSARLRTGD